MLGHPQSHSYSLTTSFSNLAALKFSGNVFQNELNPPTTQISEFHQVALRPIAELSHFSVTAYMIHPPMYLKMP